MHLPPHRPGGSNLLPVCSPRREQMTDRWVVDREESGSLAFGAVGKCDFLTALALADVDDLSSSEQAVADRHPALSIHTRRRLLDAAPALTGIVADRGDDLFGQRLVVEFFLLLDVEAFHVGPDQLQSLLVPGGRPARLLDVEAHAAMSLCLNMEECVPRAFPGTRDLAALVFVVDQDDGNAALGLRAYLIDECREVADLLQRPSLVHAQARDGPKDDDLDLALPDLGGDRLPPGRIGAGSASNSVVHRARRSKPQFATANVRRTRRSRTA